MKRRQIAIFLAAVLIIVGMFSSCKEPEPLRILVDADAREFSEHSCKKMMEEFVEIATVLGGPSDVIVEVLPDLDEERETAIQRIRTEIMAGDGPDLFIVRSNKGMNSLELLFPIPEKAMANGLFLPLDDYIEKAQFMEWDKHTAAIMAAGRDAYGQQMIPMVYTTPLTFFRESDIPEVKPEKETTWQDMLEDESGVLPTATTWFHRGEEEYNFEYSDGHYLDYILGDLADFETDKLLFTEDELLQRVTEVIEMEKAYAADKFEHVPKHYQTRMHVGYDYALDHGFPIGRWVDTRSWGDDPYRGIRFEDAQTMIPIYSDDGGVTATIAAFAAINANTKRADDAFFILDLLFSREWQQKLDLYSTYFGGGAAGIPVHEDLMQIQYPVDDIFYITTDNFEEYSRVREQITRAYFRGDFTDSFDELYKQCKVAYEQDEDLMPIVSEFYEKLKIMMAE